MPKSYPEDVSKPRRIQLRRTKGWRKPEGAIVVSRPSKWGNPYRASPGLTVQGAVWRYRDLIDLASRGVVLPALRGIAPWTDPGILATIRTELGGRDLACWCPLDQPCHADVLMEIANA